MKKSNNILYHLLASILLLNFTACSDFLDKQPIDAFTDENYWTSEANLKSFSWKFYSDFIGYGSGAGTTAEFYFQSAPANGCINISDDLASSTYLEYQANSSTTNTEWKNYYTTVRRANLMIARIGQVPGLSEEASKHWNGVARFFRAYSYFRLVQRFGDIPYSEEYIASNDFDNIYRPRTDRNTVMDKIKADLEIAVSSLREQDGVNTVNKYTALALLSRVCLYEGTYRKYHNIGDGTEFLTRAKSAANEIMISGLYQLGSNFQATYNSIELKNGKEMILYLDYQSNIYMHSIQNYTNTSSIINGMTKAAVETYACTDGLPIKQSILYAGDTTYESVLKNRDKRLISALHLESFGYSGRTTTDGLAASSGYVIALYNNAAIPRTDVTSGGRNYIDAPIFGLAEVMLNYAEASAELGALTQAELDQSINLLRNRAGIARLTYVSPDNVQVNGLQINDPKRTNGLELISGAVPSIIWEIRRERRAELMTWTHLRYYDLMRWKKGEYLDMTQNPDVGLGARVGEENRGTTTINQDGYIVIYPNFSRKFDPAKHYLNAIPINDITLYANEGIELTQNPNWNK